MILFIRSLLFNLFFYIWTAVCCIVQIPLLFTKAKTAKFAGLVWSSGIIYALKIITGITYEERGQENLPKSGGYVLASKHQSAWETIIFLKILPNPCYILKEELLKVPFFGRYLKAMEMIAVNRSGGASALRSMISQVNDRVKSNCNIIIFPEGTRTKLYDKPRYHPGIAMIYKESANSFPIIPVALNSGYFWGKGQFTKPKGRIIIHYLPPLPSNLTNKEYLLQLENIVESKSIELLNEIK